jgi:hypothetical protein
MHRIDSLCMTNTHVCKNFAVSEESQHDSAGESRHRLLADTVTMRSGMLR